ncbi:MAG TPA: signal peptidase II [Longimicrobiales bacterium]|nr:signal peptidase II [Longimicrobiales bacterium]
MNRKAKILATVLPTVVVVDIVTKWWAQNTLVHGRPVFLLERVFGDGLPLMLTYNTGAAFSLHVGDASRWFFLVVSVFALGLIAWMYHEAEEHDTLRLGALALVAAGALGNLIDRVRWDRGVVDFIGPVDLGFMRWPIFNAADSAVTVGAVLLVISLVLEDRATRRAARDAVDDDGAATPRGIMSDDALEGGGP